MNPGPAFINELLQSAQRLSGWHPDVSEAGAQPPRASLEPNQTLLPADLRMGDGPSLCVELKPKCGFLPTAVTVAPEHRHLKGSISRFVLQQRLKLQQVRGWPVGAPVTTLMAQPLVLPSMLGAVHIPQTHVHHRRCQSLKRTVVIAQQRSRRVSQQPIHAQGGISRASEYDPLDLFSKDPDRVRCAVAALLENPQNNLRIFRNGRPQTVRWDAVRAD